MAKDSPERSELDKALDTETWEHISASATRLATAHERIATAFERIASAIEREGRDDHGA